MNSVSRKASSVARPYRMRLRGALACILICTCGTAAAFAGSPGVYTHESYVEDVTRMWNLNINDEKAVFAFVFNTLPDRVKVYPTENYYYFKFNYRGSQFSGNIRFQMETRDQGKLHFAYATDFTQWLPVVEMFHALFERADGIDLDKIDALTYRVTYGGKSVVFELNDLSHVKPPAGMLAADERFIGPIFDDSAVRFFLVYNSKLKQFLYLLDETAPPSDVWVPLQVSNRILIGRRTGFAFYRDHKIDRKILIGVYEGNVAVNNYFDGPFDQLPDNFIEGESLRSAIVEVEPELKGKIDRLGNNFDGETRYAIAPYLEYTVQRELVTFDRCATRNRIHSNSYYTCFVSGNSALQKPTVAEPRHRRIKSNRPARELQGR
jgi:hypothetical protein